MAVGVEGHGHRGVAEQLLHELGVDAAAEQDGGARVPERGSTSLGPPRRSLA